MLIPRRSRCSFRRQKNPLILRPILQRRQNLLIRERQCDATRLLQNLQHDVIPVRFRHAQTRRKRRRVFPHPAHLFVLLERPCHWRASGRLHRDHFRPFPRLHPTQFLQLRKRFPHPNQSNTTARRIEHCFRIFPSELFHQLVPHSLFPLNSERLLQRRNVKPPFLLSPVRHP